MDAVERQRSLSGRLVTVLLTGVALLAAGCVGGDDVVASFDQATTLPTPSTGSSVTSSTAGESTASESTGTDATDASSTTTEPPAPLRGLEAELVADGFDQPVFVTGAPGTDLLYVVEREGLIRTVDGGVISDQPFLDLTDRLLSNSIEQGLLGLAFDPDFASNRRLYAYWTDVDGDSVLARFLAADPATAEPASEEILLQVDQPAERHNAGMIQFGPEGLLYLAIGDGGDGGRSAQDTSNLLGAILRLDVSSDGGASVPAGNPFGNEIWVYGLRNPWRFSIDPVDGLLYIGDVGQERFEEVNVVPLDAAGTNFGWFEMEGDRCFRSGCDEDGKTPPVLQYSHDDGCSITGGHVYRGPAIPEFNGHYFFADWCEGFVRSFRYAEGRVVDQADWSADLSGVGEVTSFGVDNEGEFYTVNWDGQLHRIVPVR